MAFVASLLAIAFAALLLRQMWLGWLELPAFPETTPVLRPAALDRVPADPRLARAAARRAARRVDRWRTTGGPRAGTPALAPPAGESMP